MKNYIRPLIALTLVALFVSPLATAAVYEDTGETSQKIAETQLDAPIDFLDSSNIELYSEDPAIMQKDLDNNFQHYAEEKATVMFPTPYSEKEESVKTANVVGIVLDEESDDPVPEASIFADGIYIVSTGTDGRFQIENMPDGIYTWTIRRDNYGDSMYMNYPVDGSAGANIFTFNLNKEHDLTKDRNDIGHGNCNFMVDKPRAATEEVETLAL